jgi:hypothetical protein
MNVSARRIYGAAASYSGAGGGIDRRRWNRAAAARWENGGRGHGGIFSRYVFTRVRRDVARCSRRVTFGAPDSLKRRALHFYRFGF